MFPGMYRDLAYHKGDEPMTLKTVVYIHCNGDKCDAKAEYHGDHGFLSVMVDGRLKDYCPECRKTRE